MARAPMLLEPRWSEEAECSVIGGMLLDVDALDRAREMLEARCFYGTQYRLMFETISRLRDQGTEPDALLLRDELLRRGELEKAGGEEAIAGIVDAIPTARNLEFHAHRVRDDATVRAIGEVGGRLLEQSRNGTTAAQLLAEAEARVFALSEGRTGDSEVLVADALAHAIESMERREDNAIPTPWSRINRSLTGGFQPGELGVVAARPSVGKSCFLAQTSLHAAARYGAQVLFVSLEMSAGSLVRRLLYMASGLPSELIGPSAVRGEDEELAYQAGLRVLKRIELRIATGLDSIAQIVSRVRRFAAHSHRPLVVIDYLQLVAGPGDTRAEQVGAVSRALKRLAIEIDAPVVAAAQLNREAEKRAGRPQLSDLRESGAVEADADVVLLLERPEILLVDSEIKPEDRGLCRCWIRKNRNGPTGDVDLHFTAATGIFTERETRR